MRSRQSVTRSSAVQSKQLLSERQVFEKEILAGAEQANHPTDEVPKRGDHSENLIAILDFSLFASRSFHEGERF